MWSQSTVIELRVNGLLIMVAANHHHVLEVDDGCFTVFLDDRLGYLSQALPGVCATETNLTKAETWEVNEVDIVVTSIAVNQVGAVGD